MRLWLPARKARLPIPCFSALSGGAAERPSRCRSASEDRLTEAQGRNMKSLMFVAAIAGMMASLPAAAEEREAIGAPGDGSVKINQLIVYGDDPCPESNADQITVCARKGENERFRIPEALREDPNAPGNESWTNRAVAMEYVGRSGTDSCSPVGGGGFTGCFSKLRSEEHTSELQSLIRISYAVFCLKKKKPHKSE